MTSVHLGFEVTTGAAVEIPLRHMAVTGQTQESGKTTSLEALVSRAGVNAVAFITKRGEASFSGGNRLAPYFRDRADWQFVSSILDATLQEKNKFLRPWIIKICRSTQTLGDVQRAVRKALLKARGVHEGVYTQLDAYLDLIVPEIERGAGRWTESPTVAMVRGLNVMDLSGYATPMQIHIRACAEEKAATLLQPVQPMSYRDPADRRTYHREWYRRKRERDIMTQRKGKKFCPKRVGPGTCGGLLEHHTDALGRLVITCSWCERKRQGVCRECPRPVHGRLGYALRCAEHTRLAKLAQKYQWDDLHREKRLARNRELYHANPDRVARHNEYKRLWRKANREKIRAQKRREGLREGKPRERRLSWHRKYNAKKRRLTSKREWARRRYYELHPERPRPKCRGCGGWLNWAPGPGRGKPPAWCDACCWPHERRRRAARGISIGTCLTPPDPLVTVPAPAPPRTCITVGCSAVLISRAKKCDACKAREREQALELLRSVEVAA